MAINASAELSVLQAVAQFLTYAVMAVFAENAVFFRALGVSRLNKLVNDPKISTWQYCIPIILVQTISAPMGWAAQSLALPALAKVLPGWLPVNALRPLVFLNCSLIAMGIVWLLLGLLPKSRDACREQLPGATFNCCVLGTLLQPARTITCCSPSASALAAAWATWSPCWWWMKAVAGCAAKISHIYSAACPVC